MADVESVSHGSNSPPPVNSPLETQPNLPTNSTDFPPEEETGIHFMLQNAVHKVEKERIFNSIFILIFILSCVCMLISCLIAIWGDDWFSN